MIDSFIAHETISQLTEEVFSFFKLFLRLPEIWWSVITFHETLSQFSASIRNRPLLLSLLISITIVNYDIIAIIDNF